MSTGNGDTTHMPGGNRAGRVRPATTGLRGEHCERISRRREVVGALEDGDGDGIEGSLDHVPEQHTASAVRHQEDVASGRREALDLVEELAVDHLVVLPDEHQHVVVREPQAPMSIMPTGSAHPGTVPGDIPDGGRDRWTDWRRGASWHRASSPSFGGVYATAASAFTCRCTRPSIPTIPRIRSGLTASLNPSVSG